MWYVRHLLFRNFFKFVMDFQVYLLYFIVCSVAYAAILF